MSILGKKLWAIDQYGQLWGPLDPRCPKKSLLDHTCRRSATQMMNSDREGDHHVGYVVSTERGTSNLWCRLFWRTDEQWRPT